MSATINVEAHREGPGGNGGKGRGRRGACRTRWRPLEIAAIVLGFIVFWPLGLGMLLWKLWRTRRGEPADIVDAARNLEEKVMHSWPEKARRWRAENWGYGRSSERADRAPWAAGGGYSTGNHAFDEWREAELKRLDEERRKLESAAREFADYVEQLRRARDREEFDRFMRERGSGNGPSSGPSTGPSGGPAAPQA